MSVEAIAAIGPEAPLRAVAEAAQPAGGSQFSAVLDHLSALNQQMHVNDKSVQALALGETDNLHQVMMNMERTKLTFELVLQVRNKTLEAYQELMRMQV